MRHIKKFNEEAEFEQESIDGNPVITWQMLIDAANDGKFEKENHPDDIEYFILHHSDC